MFLKQYSHYYDLFYKTKAYSRECAMLEELFKKYAGSKPKTILDLGCGTGSHIAELAKRGYEVTGIDRSREMLAVARKKLKKFRKIRLISSTFQTFHLGQKFDAVICMFSAINYLTRLSDLKRMFRNVRHHMRDDSLFVFDFWNGEAVESSYSKRRQGEYHSNGCAISRNSVTTLNRKRRFCTVSYTGTYQKNRKTSTLFQEKHVLKYYKVKEMERLLQQNGFQALEMHPFMEMGGKIKKSTWDVTMVAKKDKT